MTTKKQKMSNDSCLYCKGLFAEDKNGEGWCMCMFCHRWSHDKCARLDSDDDEYACTFFR